MNKLPLFVAVLIVSSHVTFAAQNISDVPYQLGPQRFNGGDSIVIEQVQASSPQLAIGDQVTVRGRYVLASHGQAQLSLFLATSEPRLQCPRGKSNM